MPHAKLENFDDAFLSYYATFSRGDGGKQENKLCKSGERGEQKLLIFLCI